MNELKEIRTARAMVTILLILSMLLAIMQHNCIYNLSHVKAEFVTTESESFRKMDFEDGSISLLLYLSDEWGIDIGEFTAAIMLKNHYSCSLKAIEKETGDTVRMFIRKMYRFYPEEFAHLSKLYSAVLNDASTAFFPVPISTDVHHKWVEYVDSWGFERTYGGSRKHEGTDIMALDNVRGQYPVLSVSGGTVVNKGWLEKGGYRIGIMSDEGVYYYYAHLDSYAQGIEVGQTVFPGTLLGMMGDSGYSKVEGTKGKFDVHLHFGMYIYEDNVEISINPYNLLKFYENKIMQYSY
ncbi:MAG: M23 family metallopeptidase [Bacteroides sp.]